MLVTKIVWKEIQPWFFSVLKLLIILKYSEILFQANPIPYFLLHLTELMIIFESLLVIVSVFYFQELLRTRSSAYTCLLSSFFSFLLNGFFLSAFSLFWQRKGFSCLVRSLDHQEASFSIFAPILASRHFPCSILWPISFHESHSDFPSDGKASNTHLCHGGP